jgi:hypothetical protein
MEIINNENAVVDHQRVIAEVVKIMVIQNLFSSDNCKNFELEVKWFDNCRERGYMYRLLNAKQDYTFSVYEHRNSDSIIINGCKTESVESFGAYKGDKWDYYHKYTYDQHYYVAKKLTRMLVTCFRGEFEE